jgi:hypothetical protein
MKSKFIILLASYLLGLTALHLPFHSTALAQSQTEPRAAPTIEFYTASQQIIHQIQPVRLSWRVHNAVRVDVYDGYRNTTYELLGNENYIEVWPERTAKYVLLAYGADGQSVSQEITITVDFYKVVVDHFTAAPQLVDPREPVKLWWSVQNAKLVDVIDVNKSTTYPNLGNENYIYVYPEVTSRYVLQARGDGGQLQQEEVTVFVRQYRPTIDYFHAGAYQVSPGEGVLLRWKVSHAVRAEIFDGSKNATYPVGLQGEILVHPDRNSIFYIYAYDEKDQVATRELFIRVKP